MSTPELLITYGVIIRLVALLIGGVLVPGGIWRFIKLRRGGVGYV